MSPEAGPPLIDDKRDPAAFTTIVAMRWDRSGPVQLGILNRLAEDLADRMRNVDPKARAGDRDAVAEQVVGTTRHILSTTLTTIGGFLPLLLIVGGEFWPSLAIVLAGGVGGSTILALVFVPAVYALLVRANDDAKGTLVEPQLEHASPGLS